MDASRNKTDLAAQLATRLRAHLATLLPKDAPLWVGLSGGRDSVVLLHLCNTLLPERVHALHVHHGLSPHADAWAAFCEQLCHEWNVPYTQKKVAVPRHAGQGPEAAARHARYQAFADSDALYLALAHHQRDQAETLLFNLCRGAGVIGAAAMPYLRKIPRKIGDLTLLRPLLDTSAHAIAAYAAAHQLSWVEDESNADTAYSRNFLRHQILPELTSRFPAAETTLARAAGHFAEAQELLDTLGAQDDVKIQAELPPLLTLPHARQANWLRYWLRKQGWHAHETAALHEALRQLAMLADERDHHFALGLPQGELRLWQNRLYCVPHIAPLTEREWDGSPIAWADGWLTLEPCTGEGLSAALIAGKTLTIRPRQGGEHLTPQTNRPRRTLRNLLQENHIPPWERERLPLVYLGEELVAVPDVAVAAEWKCQEGQAGMQVCLKK